MKNSKIAVFLSLLITAVIFNLTLNIVPLVWAQSADKDTIYQVESYAQEIRQLKVQYRGELQEYHQAEDQYRIAKQQYQQLQTLDSLEKALRNTQKAMRLRGLVLTTYLRLLRYQLLSQPGIELEAKKANDARLKEVIALLESHYTEFGQDLDRPALNTVALTFTDELAPLVTEVSYQTLTNLKVGRLQTVYDKSYDLHLDMETQLATESSSITSAARQRSFAENERLLQSLQPKFDQLESKIGQAETDDFSSLYRQFKNPLEETYVSLRRSLNYLAELLEE